MKADIVNSKPHIHIDHVNLRHGLLLPLYVRATSHHLLRALTSAKCTGKDIKTDGTQKPDY